jgi:hypothetical protein
MRVIVLVLALSLTGCNRLHYVQAYQQKATAKCLEHHTADECKPLSYPSCEQGFSGPECHR